MEQVEKKIKKYVISRGFDTFFIKIFEAWRFFKRFFTELRPPYEWNEIVKQCYQVGYRSLGLVSLTGFITGMVFTKQSRPSLSDFGAASWLPSLMAIAIIRALAPLVTALICAGKVGSNIGAELGSMKVTEQIDSMEVSATNPYKFLVVSRVLATTLMIPLLTFYSAFVGLMGAYLDVRIHEQTSFTTFFENAFSPISFLDIGATIVKSICFGFTIGMVSCYQGYHATQGTEGVGRAANFSVVISMFLIFLEEIILVQVANYIR